MNDYPSNIHSTNVTYSVVWVRGYFPDLNNLALPSSSVNDRVPEIGSLVPGRVTYKIDT